jgi:hypothetical protein
MRKTVVTVILLCLLWISYTTWPLYDLFLLVRAFETRDVNTVVRHVYFDAVRKSLTNQVIAAYVRRTGIMARTIDILSDCVVQMATEKPPPVRRLRKLTHLLASPPTEIERRKSHHNILHGRCMR